MSRRLDSKSRKLRNSLLSNPFSLPGVLAYFKSMYSPNSSRSRLQAFTLIELLVVIAIIGVLAALLFSVIGRMQNSAGTTKTVGNLKQLMSASFAYAAEHNGHYVPIRIDVVSWPQGGPDALPNALNRWMTHPKFLAYFGIEGNEMISGQPKNWAPVAMSGRNVTVLARPLVSTKPI